MLFDSLAAQARGLGDAFDPEQRCQVSEGLAKLGHADKDPFQP